MSVVRALCRNVAVMEDGRVVEQFPMDQAQGGSRLTDLGRELHYA
jgi:D-methionine transport system ATP-binding protein